MNQSHPAQLLFTDKHPLTSALNMKFEVPAPQTLTISVKAPESFSDRDGIHVHTGFSTLLLDTVMGSCAIGELKKAQPIATIKLTCNHLARPSIGEQLVCQSTYDGEENGIAYVSGKILAGADHRLIATGIGTFMIGTATTSIREKS